MTSKEAEERVEMFLSKRNGIFCPICDAEMRDSDFKILLLSPPRRNIDCPNCGYRTTRLVSPPKPNAE